jgi:endonuclease/exonuclease/phosphatase family metal-dependent hydrolase
MRKLGKLLPFVLALAGALVWHASRLRPIGPTDGTALAGQVSQTAAVGPTSLRIGTFNIHGCTGADGRRDIERVAECLKGLDVVALNEVHGSRLWEGTDQADELGRRLGLAWLFAPNTRSWYHLDFGNALLSDLPAESWRSMPLEPPARHGFRNMVHVGLRHGSRTVQVLVTHIARSDEHCRRAQLRAAIDYYLTLAEPAILLGDMNSEADDPEIRRLLASPGVLDPVGEVLGDKAPPRIDWIFVRGMKCRTAGITDRGASDHPLVWAEVR